MPSRQCRQQALIDAPVQIVWNLVGDPNHHAAWWPTVVDSECEQVEQGCRYRAVVKSPRGKVEEHQFAIDRLDDCHEVVIRCVDIGTYTRFQLVEAQGGTFVDAEFGIDPEAAVVANPQFDPETSRDQLRRWVYSSLDGLAGAAQAERAGG